MSRKNGDDTFGQLPPKNQLVPIDPVIESIQDLAGRRDALRLMSRRATEEADRLDQEIQTTVGGHLRQLRSLTAALDERPT